MCDESALIAKYEDMLRKIEPHSEEIKIDNEIDKYDQKIRTLVSCWHCAQLEMPSGYHYNATIGTCDSDIENMGSKW